MRRVCLLLEDAEGRVRWLADRCAKRNVELVSTARVNEFCAEYAKNRLDLVAVVLDHDLGGYSMPVSLQDCDGLDGLDAVERMPASGRIEAPVLVWSANPGEATKMEESLKSRAYDVTRADWTHERKQISTWLDAHL